MIQSLAWQPDLFTQISYACFSNRPIAGTICSCNNGNNRGSTSNNSGSNNIYSGIDDASCLQR